MGSVIRRATRTANKKGLTGKRKRRYVGGAVHRAKEGSGSSKGYKHLKLRKAPRRYVPRAH